MQFWPPDGEHMVLETCSHEIDIVKQKLCASSWLITKINILRCTVSKTSKNNLHSLRRLVTKFKGQSKRPHKHHQHHSTSLLVVKLYTAKWYSLSPRYRPPRFAIFLYSDSQITIPEIRSPPRIPATATPRPTKLPTQGQTGIFIHPQDKRRYLQIVSVNGCEGTHQSQSGLWGPSAP